MGGYKTDVGVLLGWPVLAVLLSLYVSVDYLGSIVLFFGVPAVYLSFRRPDMIGKASVFSVIVAVPVALIADSLFHATHTYIIHTTVFPFRVFGLFPVESFFWGFFGAYLPIMCYERFVHNHVREKIVYPRMKYLVALSVSLVLLSIILFKDVSQLALPYAYIIIGSIFVLTPVLVELYEHPAVLKRMSVIGAYFFLLALLYEWTALNLELWTYYTEYTSFLGWVTVADVRFPVEEVIFWFTLLSFAVISLYDIWDDYPHR